MTLLHFLKALRTYWWVAVSVCVLGLIAGGVWQSSGAKSYSAQSSVILTPKLTGGGSSTGAAADAQQMMPSYSALVTSQPVLEPVARTVGDGVTWEDLRSKVVAHVPVESTIIEVGVTDSSPQRAAAVADAIPAELTRVVQRLNSSSSAVTVTQLDKASVPQAANGPSLTSALTVGGVLGLLVGLGLAAAIYLARLRARQ